MINKRLFDEVKARLVLSGKSILEIALDAEFSRLLAQETKNATCVIADIDKPRPHVPRDESFNVHLVHPTILPSKNDQYDIVIIREVLQYAIGHIDQIVREAWRVLKQGGTIVVLQEVPMFDRHYDHYFRILALKEPQVILSHMEISAFLHRFRKIRGYPVVFYDWKVELDAVKKYYTKNSKDLNECGYRLIDGELHFNRRFQVIMADKTDYRPGLYSWSWWDGPSKYQFVNRNVIAGAQRDTFFKTVASLSGPVGIEIGGGGFQYNGTMVYGVNIERGAHLTADGSILPFQDNSLDLIFSNHTLEHIPDTMKTLTDWKRALKPGGLIVTVLPDKRHFRHYNLPNIKKCDYAPSEMEPKELQEIIENIGGLEILSFDSRQNNFDFECLLRKKESE